LLGRPAITAGEYLERAARLLDLDLEALASRRKISDVVRARELLTVVGVERLVGRRVRDIAQCLAKQPATGSFWIMRCIRRRREDPSVAPSHVMGPSEEPSAVRCSAPGGGEGNERQTPCRETQLECRGAVCVNLKKGPCGGLTPPSFSNSINGA